MPPNISLRTEQIIQNGIKYVILLFITVGIYKTESKFYLKKIKKNLMAEILGEVWELELNIKPSFCIRGIIYKT